MLKMQVGNALCYAGYAARKCGVCGGLCAQGLVTQFIDLDPSQHEIWSESVIEHDLTLICRGRGRGTVSWPVEIPVKSTMRFSTICRDRNDSSSLVSSRGVSSIDAEEILRGN